MIGGGNSEQTKPSSFGFGGMSFPSNQGLSGFQPATGSNANWGFQPATTGPSGVFGNSPNGAMEEEDFLDDEERERVMRVQAEQEERKRALFVK